MKGFTTTETLPPGIRAEYEMPTPLEGGPVFVLPRYGGRVDFSTIEPAHAAALVKMGCPYLRKKAVKPQAVPKEAEPK